MSSCIAIIPARGGSKRIPKKNIKHFLGKPIIAYAIEAALKSKVFDEVMVSTDSEEIAETAKRYGASVPFMRSADMADDFATTDDVLLDVVKQYLNRGRTFKYMACIYPTAPFVTPSALQEAMELLKKHTDADMVMPVTAFSYPPQRCFFIDEAGLAQFKNPEYISARSQDLEKLFHDAGQYYIYDTEKFIEAEGRIYNNIVPIVVDEMAAQDIDNASDWELAELKFQILNKAKAVF